MKADLHEQVKRISPELQFNQAQMEAIELAHTWFQGFKGKVKHGQDKPKPWFMLSGYAGTGKTTSAKTIAALCSPRALFVAPTGKAASMLRRKGNPGASTIHRAIYQTNYDELTRKFSFTLRNRLVDHSGKPYELIVCDESSMVGQKLGTDLLSFGIPILALGDPAQLPPVQDTAVFTVGDPDYLLQKIMRQAKDSMILKAARAVRKGKELEVFDFPDLKVRKYGYPPTKEILQFAGLEDDSQVICGYNKSRQKYNQLIRSSLGFKGLVPNVGEKIICTFNDYDQGICNGEQFVLTSKPEPVPPDPNVHPSKRKNLARFNARPSWDLKGEVVNLLMDLDCFQHQDPVERSKAMSRVYGFDYGYVITCHKSQGSEWERVLVIREPIPDSDPNWTYTAITRASKHLTMYW